MIDREKVIKGLPCLTGVPIYCETCPYSDEFGFGYGDRRCAEKCASDALELLKEQETVKPEWSNGKAFCGKCGQPFPRHRGSLRRYCSYCGQAVKWE